MKKAITAAWVTFLPFFVFAQIGLTNGYQSLEAPNWEQKLRQRYELPDVKIFSPSFFTGFNLYFPSKKKGIQWTPEFYLSRHEVELTNPNPDSGEPTIDFGTITDTHRSINAGFTLNGEFFFLRMAHPNGDPALDQLSHIKRGLFLRLGLGFGIINQRRRSNIFDFGFGGNSGLNQKTVAAGHFRIGLGLENEISNFLTISPIISSTFHTNTPWITLITRGQEVTFDPFGNPIYTNNALIDYDSAPRDAFFNLQAAIRIKINIKEFVKAFKGT